jgi:V8-like Glu-specific endopeptidase
VEVIPGQNGLDKPFLTAVSTTFYTPVGWQQDADPALDYGVALLSTGVGSIVGSYGYASYGDDDLRSTIANIAGYPADPPDEKSPDALLWYAARQIEDVDESFVYYDVPADAGESGAAVYRNIGSQPFALAIHTSVDPRINRGLRITEHVYNNLQQWAAMRA